MSNSIQFLLFITLSFTASGCVTLQTSEETSCVYSSDCLDGRECCDGSCHEAGECPLCVDWAADFTTDAGVCDIEGWTLDPKWECTEVDGVGTLAAEIVVGDMGAWGVPRTLARSPAFDVGSCDRLELEMEHLYALGGHANVRATLQPVGDSDRAEIVLFDVTGPVVPDHGVETAIYLPAYRGPVVPGRYRLVLRDGLVDDAVLNFNTRAAWQIDRIQLRGW